MDLNELIKNKNFLNTNLNFLDLFLINLKADLLNIKSYYLNYFNYKKMIKNKILFLFLLPLFYSILIINNLFLQFLLIKFIFYTIKYLFKYIFLFFDFIYNKYAVKSKYLKFIFKLFYIISVKLFYNIYLLIFYILPQLIFVDFWVSLIKLLKNNLYIKVHFILDFIEGIPTSKFSRYISYFYKSIEEGIIKIYKNYFRKEARNYYYEKYKIYFYILHKFPYILYNKSKVSLKYIIIKNYFFNNYTLINIVYTNKIYNYYEYITIIYYYNYIFLIMSLFSKLILLIIKSKNFFIFCIVRLIYMVKYLKYKIF